MSDSAGDRRIPVTTWEYAVSAADQLLLWHADTAPDLLREPLRTRTVVLVAAAVADTARVREMAGAAVTGVPLDAAAACVQLHAASALEGCSAPARAGAEEVGLLLAAYGTREFEAVQKTALEVLEHHIQDAGGGPVTIADRREALQQAARRRHLEALASTVGEEDF